MLALDLCLSSLVIAIVFDYRRFVDLLVTGFSWVVNYYLKLRYPIRDVAGREAIPSLPYIWPDGTGDVEKFYRGTHNSEVWRRRYGPIYRLWAGNKPEVVISDPAHLKEVFSDSDRHIKAVNNGSGYLMSQVLGQCVGLLSGHEWKHLRSKMEPPFTRQAIKKSSPLILSETERYVQSLKKSENVRNGFLNAHEDVAFYPLLVTAMLVYGKLEDKQIEQLKTIIPVREELFQYVMGGGLARFSLSRFLPTHANRLLKRFKSLWKDFNGSIYLERKGSGIEVPITVLWEEALEGTLSQVQLLQTLDEVLFANLDVTNSALAWNLVYMAAYPKIQAELLEEVREQLKKDGGSLHDYFASNKSFLAACINETARHRPILSFSIPQAPAADRKVGTWLLPKGTMVIIDTFAVNMREEYWGSDCLEYNPARFFSMTGTDTRYKFWRYGVGPRQCMGKYLADYMLRAIVAHIIIEFELDIPEEEREKALNANLPASWVRTPHAKLICRQRGSSVL